jgi:hypothetical protein
MVHWQQNNATKIWEPSRYPSDIKFEDYTLPEGIQSTFQQLNSLIEQKYSREHIKMCAFYNKLFPSLKSWDYTQSTHNSLPFSVQEQEREDGGTGISENFLKNAIDKVVARLANIKFDVFLQSDVPNLLVEIYKDPIERYLRSIIKSNKILRSVTEVFHDAAILSFGYLFIDPWSGNIRKISDWELGCYESEFTYGSLKRALIRDFKFPVAELGPYIKGMKKEDIEKVISGRSSVDLKLYIDAIRKCAIATIESTTMPSIPYPFDEVLISTFSWDLGIKRTTVCSLFDMLYPIQRTISKLNAKKTQLIDGYKGPVPVFNNDCDIIVKNMGNGAGEALFLASGRNPAEVITVINATPLDPEMNAEKESLKTTLQELAGAQELSLDMENIRSAATVIALDQLHDELFQSQLAQIGTFVSETMEMAMRFAASRPDEAIPIENVPWSDINQLLDEAYVRIEVVHNNDPNNTKQVPGPDYVMVLVDRAIVDILQGKIVFEDIRDDYTIDKMLLRKVMALKMVKLRAMGSSNNVVVDRLERALLGAFVEDIKMGKVEL